MSLYFELKRRNVFRVGAAYIVAAWLIIQVAETIFPLYGLGDTPARITVTLLAIGFPLFLVFSWVFEITPEGLRLEKDIDRTVSVTHKTGKQLDRIIIVLLALAVGYFSFDKFVLEPTRVADIVAETAQQARSEALVESYGDKSIAVLPFVNMSADPEQEYFSDGISEELLNLLAQIPELRVISRSSTFSYKDKDIKLNQIAEELNVAHILEGSVRKSGDRVRITAQLIEARSDTHLWSQTYDRQLIDIFAVQDEIASAIVAALRIQLVQETGDSTLSASIRTASTAAYDAYLKGRAAMRTRGAEELNRAVDEFERALRLDDRFAPAHAQLARAILLRSSWYGEDLEAARRAAQVHLDRADELQHGLADTFTGRSQLAVSVDPEASIEYARQALALNPSDSEAMNYRYLSLLSLGLYNEADAALQEFLSRDPLTAIGRWNYAWRLSAKERFAEARAVADQMVSEGLLLGSFAHGMRLTSHEGKLAEGLDWALRGGNQWRAALILTFVGELEEARRINTDEVFTKLIIELYEDPDAAITKAEQFLRANPNHVGDISNAADTNYRGGRLEAALPHFERLLEIAPPGRPILQDHGIRLEQTVQLALVRRETGDMAGAQEVLEIARNDLAAHRESGIRSWQMTFTEAMIAAFDKEEDRAIETLGSAIRKGLRNPLWLQDPVFDELRDDPRFSALQEELDSILAVEHEKVLQLICFNNPVPDEWRPLPETCEGVVDRGDL